VTLGYGRTFYLNEAAFEGLGRPEAVELMFDDLRNLIGMRATNPEKRNAFPVKPHTTGRYRRVSAAPFCTQFSIRPEGTILFDRASISPEGILELPLDKLLKVVRGSR
jgi:hypothetical protein